MACPAAKCREECRLGGLEEGRLVERKQEKSCFIFFCPSICCSVHIQGGRMGILHPAGSAHMGAWGCSPAAQLETRRFGFTHGGGRP